MLVDSHAHLFFENFADDLEAVLDRAREAGVNYILVPGTDVATSRQAVELADKYEMIYASAGIHPHDTKDYESSWLKDIEELTRHEKVVAVGEIGLDYYYDFSPRDIQIRAFEEQIELAIKLDLPVIVHNRESNDDIMSIARKYKDSGLRAQFHCFAGSAADAKELIRMRHYISFPGNITFKKAESLREVLSAVSVENLLIETDSPFMTPVPHRGKRNEPAYVKLVAEKIAEVKKTGVEEVERTTAYNAYKLFGIGEKPDISYTYEIGDSLYINVTNRCNADCVFCDRKGEAMIKGYNLKMKKSEEPEADIYMRQIGNPKKYKEIVFCGYGEPTIRFDVVKEVAAYVKKYGGKTRLNTDGHGNFINKRDITPELEGLIDTVSLSLNSTDPHQYAELMRVAPDLHSEMIDFAKKADKYSHVVMTIVGLDEVKTEEAKDFVVNKMGVDFRLREYF